MKRILCILTAVCFAGCGFMHPDIRLKRTVSPSEVVGVWTLTKDSFEDIKTDADAKPLAGTHTDFTIELRPDGTVVYRSLLQVPTRKVDYTGSWEVKSHCKNKNASILTLLFDTNGQHQHSLDFTEEDGKLVIWEYFGDPDSWRLAEYSK